MKPRVEELSPAWVAERNKITLTPKSALATTPTYRHARTTVSPMAFSPCHDSGAVGPMAGVISPGTPLLVIEDPVNRTSACTFIADAEAIVRR